MKMQETSPLFSKETFLVQNQNITEIESAKQLLTDSVDIGPDDEVWLLQCPKSINPDALINRKIKLPGKSNHELLESIAELHPSAENISLGVRTNKGYKVRHVPIVGKISLRERLPVANFDVLNDDQTAGKKSVRVKFPDNLKVRHPLLGADYEEKIELRADVAARLKEARMVGVSKSARHADRVRVKVEGRKHAERAFEHVKVKTEKASPDVKKEKSRKRRRDESDVERTPQKSKKIKIEQVDDKNELDWIKKF